MFYTKRKDRGLISPVFFILLLLGSVMRSKRFLLSDKNLYYRDIKTAYRTVFAHVFIDEK